MRRCLFLALAFAAVVSASSARAEDAGVEALLARGVALREQGKDEEALGVFREAHAKSPSGRARAQVALAEQALGMWVAAEADLLAALASSETWIERHRAALDGALGVVRRHLANLELRGTEDADIYVDGARIGVGTGPFRVESGSRRLEVRAKGFHPTARTIDVPPGGVARETITLVREVSPDASAASRPLPATPGDDRGATQRLVGWVLGGSGVGLAAFGAVGLVVRQGIVDDYNTACPGVGVAQSPECESKADSARTWRALSIGALIVGGVAIAGGAVVVLTAPRSGASARAEGAVRIALRCAPSATVDRAMVGCAGTF